jgi:hypothetical protein
MLMPRQNHPSPRAPAAAGLPSSRRPPLRRFPAGPATSYRSNSRRFRPASPQAPQLLALLGGQAAGKWEQLNLLLSYHTPNYAL